MKYAGVIVGVLLSSVFVFSCKGGLENQARDVVSHYVGKTGVFPDGFTGLACMYCTGNDVDPTTEHGIKLISVSQQ